MGEVEGDGRLARTALEVGDGGPERPLARPGGIRPRRFIFMRRRRSLISSRLNHRWRPSSSTSPAGRYPPPSALEGRLVDLEDQFDTSQLKNRRSVFHLGAEGLPPDPALHLLCATAPVASPDRYA